MIMKRLLFGLLIMGLIVISGCAQQPAEKPKATESMDPLTSRDFVQENTQIFAALKSVGIEPLVDSIEDSVLVRFEIPQNYSTQTTVIAALTAAAAVTKSESVVVQVYRGEKKVEEIKTKKQKVLDFVNNKISPEDFLADLDWKKL